MLMIYIGTEAGICLHVLKTYLKVLDFIKRIGSKYKYKHFEF